MNDNNLIDVLWIEDLKSIWDSYKADAELEGIRLHPFESWEEAKPQLTENYGKWSAIILDAKCKIAKEDADNVDFLIPVLQELRALSERFHHTIPWFVLSGDIEDKLIINFLLQSSHRGWDPHKAPYYDKNTDTEELWSNIIAISGTTKSQELSITQDLYGNVFEAIRKSGLNPQVRSCMIELLRPIHFSGNLAEKSSYQNVRICIEYIFRSMIEMRIIPKDLMNDGKPILAQCCSFLLNRPNKCQDFSYTERIMSSVLATNIKYMIDVSGSRLHSDGADEDKSKDIWPYMEEVGNSPYLLRSFTLQLCDFLLWYARYLANHDNPVENGQNWSKEVQIKQYEDKEVEINIDSNGTAYYNECMISSKPNTLAKGKKVRLKGVEVNKGPNKAKYRYFAHFEPLA